ncbi:Major facilitator superfamily domain general substrate transporter [Penicillium cf. griseofulvum]|uniref:Major facilitator superfamily domain general substrate transporter n=1 Tax=Penicillium cf. griseofulvum TaxID=2972120 RepID=A0A9W9ITL6_9EURO|nr:Major facilitator superfamily domain general substrate transporter [Penicillium cf. griseofulvum]
MRNTSMPASSISTKKSGLQDPCLSFHGRNRRVFEWIHFHLVARVLMIEHPSEVSSPESNSDALGANTPLLLRRNQEVPSSTGGFWLSLLCNGRILVCLLITCSSMTVSTSLYSTLPSHIQERFEWGPGSAGLLFAGLAVPGILIGPLAGWVRDRVGARYPAVIGSILQALFLSLSGIAGSDSFSWFSAQTSGKRIYSTSVIAIGILRPFVSGIAPAELTVTAAAKTIHEKNPGPLGAEYGVSRVIAMMDVAASLGTMIGPILGGSLKALFGYEYMSLTWMQENDRKELAIDMETFNADSKENRDTT